MVADAVVEEEVAQVADDTPQVEEVAPVEPEAASTDADTPAVEEGDSSEAVPDTETETELTLDDPRLADALAERLKVERNAGAQSREAIMRKELGTEANAKARLAGYVTWAEQHGSDPEKLNLIIQDSRLNAHSDATRSLGSQALEFVNATPAQLERYQAKLESLSGTDLGTFATELFVDATEAIKSSVSSDLTLADVPDDSTLRTEITAEVARLLAAELKAQGIKAKEDGSDPAPALPTGAVAGVEGTNPLLIKLEQEGRSALTPEEIEEAFALLKLKAT